MNWSTSASLVSDNPAFAGATTGISRGRSQRERCQNQAEQKQISFHKQKVNEAS
jgi:hypothetical protein